jgi:uncharacterized protein YijF (DUF1287 family)
MNCLAICLLLIGTLQADSTGVDSINKIIENAIWQTSVTKIYDPSYVIIDYPNGDVPIERGVCCDVIIRAFRSVDIDLQKEIHNDMQKAFGLYPQIWGLNKTDTNIDHRRVPNIMTFLQRRKKSVPVSQQAEDYKPGDIVTWKIPGNIDHIGIVTNVRVENSNRYKVVHNIGAGAKLEDVLFEFEITGHYRYFNDRVFSF